MRNPLELAGAENVMARYFMHQAVEDWEDNDPWEDQPDIGEYDFRDIVLAMKDLLPRRPSTDLWNKAHDYLKERADSSIE